jgi:hypothetical protein
LQATHEVLEHLFLGQGVSFDGDGGRRTLREVEALQSLALAVEPRAQQEFRPGVRAAEARDGLRALPGGEHAGDGTREWGGMLNSER